MDKLNAARSKIERKRLHIEGEKLLAQKPTKKLPVGPKKKESRLEIEFAKALGLRKEDLDEIRRTYQKHAG